MMPTLSGPLAQGTFTSNGASKTLYDCRPAGTKR